MVPAHLLSPPAYPPDLMESGKPVTVNRCDRCGQPGDEKHHNHTDERVAVLDTAGGTDYKCFLCPRDADSNVIPRGEEHWRFMWEARRAHSGCAAAVYGPR